MSNPDPSALSKLIKQAKAGRFGDNFVSIGEAAGEELDAMQAMETNTDWAQIPLLELTTLRLVQAERDALVADKAKLIESVERQAKSILAVLHS